MEPGGWTSRRTATTAGQPRLRGRTRGEMALAGSQNLRRMGPGCAPDGDLDDLHRLQSKLPTPRDPQEIRDRRASRFGGEGCSTGRKQPSDGLQDDQETGSRNTLWWLQAMRMNSKRGPANDPHPFFGSCTQYPVCFQDGIQPLEDHPAIVAQRLKPFMGLEAGRLHPLPGSPPAAPGPVHLRLREFRQLPRDRSSAATGPCAATCRINSGSGRRQRAPGAQVSKRTTGSPRDCKRRASL